MHHLEKIIDRLDGMSVTTLAFILAFVALAVVWKALSVFSERGNSKDQQNERRK